MEVIEIPFGAKDSELQEWTYTIPEGMEAEIKDGKVIIKRKENEDERIRKDLIKYLKSCRDCLPCEDVSFYDSSIAYLEKQKEQKPEWSEEDENKLNHILEIVHIASGREASVDEKEELESFLKTLRPQSKQEWSEEDELMRTIVIQTLETFGGRGTTTMQIDWLKSLPERFNLQPKDDETEEDE